MDRQKALKKSRPRSGQREDEHGNDSTVVHAMYHRADPIGPSELGRVANMGRVGRSLEQLPPYYAVP